MDPAVLQRVRAARRDPALVVVEGLHALKHALRFGADVLAAWSPDPAAAAALAQAVAPDVASRVQDLVEPLDAGAFARLAARPPATGVLALARRPQVDVEAVLLDPGAAPVVQLERPRGIGNLGACVRAAAAAEAAGLLSSGEHDPWHPDAVRGAAGLQFALPVARVDALARYGDRPLLALDPGGEPVRPAELPSRAVLAFGSERHGLSPELLARADARIALPMRPGVSSLNLATSVAAVLYAWRLGQTM